jgi:hypothetical protein
MLLLTGSGGRGYRPESEGGTMNDQIQIKEMTDDQLRALLADIQEELDEQEWNKIVAKPRVMKRMVELARQARQELLEGKTTEGGFGREFGSHEDYDHFVSEQ